MYHPVRTEILALAVILFSVELRAQTSRVIPGRRSTVAGNSFGLAPFAADAGRFQLLIEGASVCQTSVAIDEIAFRPTLELGNSLPFQGRKISSITIWLGPSPAPRSTMSTTFAKNRGVRTVVYAGSYNLPTIQLGPSPAKWDIRIKLQKKFLYTRSSGNLLLEIEIPGVRSTFFTSFVDSDVGIGGSSQVFGSSGSFRNGEKMFVFSDPVSLRVGGTAYLGMTIVPALPTLPPAFVAYGLSKSRYGTLKLPFDLGPLGASGNKLYVSPDLLVPVVLRRGPFSFYLVAQTGVSLPNNPSLEGLLLYGQGITAAPSSNSFGAVFSDAVEMLIGKDVPPVTRSLYAHDSSALAGKFEYGSGYSDGGPVLQLSGVFK